MTFSQWLGQLNYEWLLTTLVVAAASLLCICIHETCHGFAAYKLGDPTAKRMGRLTLNPLKHIDLLGLVMMVTAHFGWAKPVPVDARYFKKPKRDMAITALAGPVSNILLTAVAMMVYSVMKCLNHAMGDPAWMEYVLLFFEYMFVLSAGLAVFNLIPIPPLDGSKVLFSFLPGKIYGTILKYERYGFLVLFVLVWAGTLSGTITTMRDWLLDTLWPVCNWPLRLYISNL